MKTECELNPRGAEIPAIRDADDFLRVKRMRGVAGYLALFMACLMLLFFAGVSLVIVLDPEAVKLALLFTLLMAFFAVRAIIVVYRPLRDDMFYFIYVGRQEIAWGDRFRHTAVQVADLAKADLTEMEMSLRLTLKNGKQFIVEKEYLLDIKGLFYRLKRIKGIRMTFENEPVNNELLG